MGRVARQMRGEWVRRGDYFYDAANTEHLGLPPILLWRAGYSATFVRRLSYLTAPLYAAQFALLHGIIPATI
ncbi:MAG: hypothetical protein V9E94_14055 [Microthrixaceae bacterium]